MEERGCFYEWAGSKKSFVPVVDKHDPVEKPAHYNQGGVECIDYIRQVLGDEGFKAYCLGNTIKYLHRHDYKGKPKEDLRKAQYYLNAAISTLEDNIDASGATYYLPNL